MDVNSSINVIIPIDSHVSHHLPPLKYERRFFARISLINRINKNRLRPRTISSFIKIFYPLNGRKSIWICGLKAKWR